MRSLRFLPFAVLALSAMSACSDDSSSPGGGTAGARDGGAASGGAAASGGTGAQSGSGGGGGAQASGGSGTLGSSGSGTLGSSGSGTMGAGGSAGVSGGGGQGGCPQANAPYPAGPYSGKLGAVFPNLLWTGHVSEAADAVATTKPFGDYALDTPRRACKGYALVHISEFG